MHVHGAPLPRCPCRGLSPHTRPATRHPCRHTNPCSCVPAAVGWPAAARRCGRWCLACAAAAVAPRCVSTAGACAWFACWARARSHKCTRCVRGRARRATDTRCGRQGWRRRGYNVGVGPRHSARLPFRAMGRLHRAHSSFCTYVAPGTAQVRDVSGRRLALKRMILQEVDQRALAQREIQAHQALGSACPFLMPLVDHEIVVAEGGTREEALLVFPLFAGSLQQVLDERAPSASARWSFWRCRLCKPWCALAWRGAACPLWLNTLPRTAPVAEVARGSSPSCHRAIALTCVCPFACSPGGVPCEPDAPIPQRAVCWTRAWRCSGLPSCAWPRNACTGWTHPSRTETSSQVGAPPRARLRGGG